MNYVIDKFRPAATMISSLRYAPLGSAIPTCRFCKVSPVTAVTTTGTTLPTSDTPDFGANVSVFDPSTGVAAIQAKLQLPAKDNEAVEAAVIDAVMAGRMDAKMDQDAETLCVKYGTTASDACKTNQTAFTHRCALFPSLISLSLCVSFVVCVFV